MFGEKASMQKFEGMEITPSVKEYVKSKDGITCTYISVNNSHLYCWCPWFEADISRIKRTHSWRPTHEPKACSYQIFYLFLSSQTFTGFHSCTALLSLSISPRLLSPSIVSLHQMAVRIYSPSASGWASAWNPRRKSWSCDENPNAKNCFILAHMHTHTHTLFENVNFTVYYVQSWAACQMWAILKFCFCMKVEIKWLGHFKVTFTPTEIELHEYLSYWG